MALGDWCISIIPLQGLGEGMTNATRCVPTLIAGQDRVGIPLSVETLRATSLLGMFEMRATSPFGSSAGMLET